MWSPEDLAGLPYLLCVVLHDADFSLKGHHHDDKKPSSLMLCVQEVTMFTVDPVGSEATRVQGRRREGTSVDRHGATAPIQRIAAFNISHNYIIRFGIF